MLTDLAGELPVAVWLMVALLLGFPSWGWYRARARRCPRCGRHALTWLDRGTFYDPHPGRSLHRCRRCGAEFAWAGGRWVARAVWDARDGEDRWDDYPPGG